MGHKLLLPFFLFILLPMFCMGQTHARYFTNYNNDFRINPGMIAKYEYSQIGGNFIQEWSGFEGAPQTFNLYYTGIEIDEERWGVAALVDYESFGLSRRFDVSAGYSYNIINVDRTLGVGLMPYGRFQNYRADNINAPGINQALVNSAKFGGAMGVYFATVDPREYHRDHFYAGISGDLFFTDIVGANEETVNYNAIFLAGYRYFIFDALHIEPRINSTFNAFSKNLLNYGFNIQIENFDYFRKKTAFGFTANAGIQINTTPGLAESNFFNSSYLSLALGAIINIDKGNYYNPKIGKVNAFFEYGLGQIAQANAFNFGLSFNLFLFDTGL